MVGVRHNTPDFVSTEFLCKHDVLGPYSMLGSQSSSVGEGHEEGGRIVDFIISLIFIRSASAEHKIGFKKCESVVRLVPVQYGV